MPFEKKNKTIFCYNFFSTLLLGKCLPHMPPFLFYFPENKVTYPRQKIEEG